MTNRSGVPAAGGRRLSSLWNVVTLGLSVAILVGVAGCAAADAESSFDPASQTFAPCPDSPNCVSTQADDAEHAIEPIPFNGSAVEARERILRIIDEMPRTTMVDETETTLHVEFRSRIFRFVDDVEFFFDEDAELIHFRSAARLGYSDMGVNRDRMEEIRRRYAAQAGG